MRRRLARRGLLATERQSRRTVEQRSLDDGFESHELKRDARRIAARHGHTLGPFSRQVWDINRYKARCTRCLGLVLINLDPGERDLKLNTRGVERPCPEATS